MYYPARPHARAQSVRARHGQASDHLSEAESGASCIAFRSSVSTQTGTATGSSEYVLTPLDPSLGREVRMLVCPVPGDGIRCHEAQTIVWRLDYVAQEPRVTHAGPYTCQLVQTW